MDKLLKMCEIFDCTLDELVTGDLTGLAFLVPAGMEHTAFQKAHPYVEDFYTDEDRAAARRRFSAALIAGLAFIFAGVGCLLMVEPVAENWALFSLVLLIAVGVWWIVRGGMLLGRVNVDEYNKSAVEDLEVEDIVAAELDEARRETLLSQKREAEKIGAVCGAVMIAATIVGLLLLFCSRPPVQSWFWVSWVVGGLLCGIVSTLMHAFRRAA